MRELVVNSIMDNIKKYYSYNEIKLKEIKYGLESLYLTITKTIVIYIICIFLNTTKELLYLFLFYGILRLTGFGVHAKKSIHCWITSLITFVLIPYLIKISIINKIIIIVSYIFYIFLMILYAPADTEKRPLINKKKRIIYKIVTVIITIIYLIISIIIKNQMLINCLYFSASYETLQILPITYKLFGVKYKNYENYRKEN